jgi:glycosyltransferase involved in cell wall biosynthesis
MLPLVSIWMTTYNHEAFIAQAIEGVLMQQTNFPYEIVIGEDCSTDRTREIVLGYKKQYPEKIRLFLPDRNLGMKPMFEASYSLCSGRYIAWLDGDDYWTDPLKLQKQVDFMEANPDFVLCFHNIKYLYQARSTEYDFAGPSCKEADNTLSLKHILNNHNHIFALTVLHRNVLGKSLPDWFYTLPYPDWGFYFLLVEHGRIKYLDEVMGVYRVHKQGSYSGLNKQLKFASIITFFKLLKENMGGLPKENINQIIGHLYYKLFKWNIKNLNIREATRNLKYIHAHDTGILKQKKIKMARLLLQVPINMAKKIRFSL